MFKSNTVSTHRNRNTGSWNTHTHTQKEESNRFTFAIRAFVMRFAKRKPQLIDIQRDSIRYFKFEI